MTGLQESFLEKISISLGFIDTEKEGSMLEDEAALHANNLMKVLRFLLDKVRCEQGQRKRWLHVLSTYRNMYTPEDKGQIFLAAKKLLSDGWSIDMQISENRQKNGRHCL